jgi:outer membrane protein TolC
LDGNNLAYDLRADIGEHLLEIPQNIVNKRVARSQLASAEYKRERKLVQYGATVARAFIEYLRIQEDLALNARRVEMAEQNRARWQNVVSSEPEAGKKKAEAEKNSQRTALVQRKLGAVRDEMLRQLIRMAGIAPETMVEAMLLPAYSLPGVELQPCLKWAMLHRSDLLAARHEIEMLQQAVKLARLDRLPKPRLSLGYTSSDWNSNADETQTAGNDGFFLALSLEIPIWDGGEISGRVRAIEAKRRGSESGLGMIEARAVQEVLKAYADLQQAALTFDMEREKTGPADEARKAGVQRRNETIGEMEYQSRIFAGAEHDAEVSRKNLACYECEIALMEAIQATSGQLHGGLKEDINATPAP